MATAALLGFYEDYGHVFTLKRVWGSKCTLEFFSYDTPPAAVERIGGPAGGGSP